MGAEPLITSLLDGYNVCVMAYGRTAAGKTYTLLGPHAADLTAVASGAGAAGGPDASPGHATSTRDAQRGLVPRSIQRLFQLMRGALATHSFKVSVRDLPLGVSTFRIWSRHRARCPLTTYDPSTNAGGPTARAAAVRLGNLQQRHRRPASPVRHNRRRQISANERRAD